MSTYEILKFCEVSKTPYGFDAEKFKAGDMKQLKLYKDAKSVNRKSFLSYDKISDDTKPINYARVVPKGCCFIDFDNGEEAEIMKRIIIRSGLKCLILKTMHGYHFLFRTPDFYDKELTGATNWFGYKFDTKQEGAVQIMRACGMEREERMSWNWDDGPIIPEKLNTEILDILPYWLWGHLSDKDLHKEGVTGDKKAPTHGEYTLTDTPFTQLMKMREGGRHDHIVVRCSYFGISNGFYIDEFRAIIQAIHDEFLVKIGTPMSDADLFGDLKTRWDGYEAILTSSSYAFHPETRKWVKLEEDAPEKIDERRAAEYVFKELDCYVDGKNPDGSYAKVLHRYRDGDYNYRNNLPERRSVLRKYSTQNFRDVFFKEMEVQLMQMCIENGRYLKRSHEYVISKNKVMSCISPITYDFSWIGTKPPTDIVLPWNWYSEEWVKEHEEDLGGIITKFIKELARDERGKTHPEVERWLWVVAGASMIPANELQKIIILAGGGSNGKSIFTSLIRFCLGDDMFNTAKIFDSNPQEGFWGAGFDKGILCVVDDLPEHYNKATFSYLKGAITGSDTVEINEKFKPKKTLAILPQIIACTNHDFELYDKSMGMRRRVKILPTAYEIPEEKRDGLMQFKLVLNTLDKDEIATYRMEHGAGSGDEGTLIIKMRTREKGVLDSLDHGSLAWFANKARYEYFKAADANFIIGDSDEMLDRFKSTFSGGFDAEMEDFLEWYVTERKTSIWIKELYLEYQNWHNEMSTGEAMMKEKVFSMRIGKAIATLQSRGYVLEMKKALNDKRMSLNKLYVNEPSKDEKDDV